MSEAFTGSFDVSPTEIPPSMQVPIDAQMQAPFTEQVTPDPVITDEMLSHLNATEIGGASGELFEIPSYPAVSDIEIIAALSECKALGKWPDWVKWLNGVTKWMDVRMVQGRLATILDRAKWNQTTQNVLEEIYCRGRNVIVIQSDKNMVRSADAGAVLTIGG